ncbi:phenylacetate--CoA ligase family protein [Indiicoccus explosivorum]|uniref:phenylacetate--CoA ligase family protein n=1 Tax=Indiicoccus explosivorum TaxID=1917864 RepID=UPI000B447881|nr:phenylacetate--CoA ligase family protein [Indiicoccus explosivorum]
MRQVQMRIYENSPIFVQNLLTNAEGYRKHKNRCGPTYFKHLKNLEKRDYANKEKLEAHQNRELQQLVRYAAEHSHFYKELYKGIDLSSIQTVNDLKKLPIVTKDLVRKNCEQLYTIPESEAVVTMTSGTSGVPLKFLNTKENFQKRNAHLDYFKLQHGVISLEMKRASFSPNKFIPPNQKADVFWRDNTAAKQRLYSTYFCHSDTARLFAANLNSYKPASIDGLPSAIYEVARWINRTGFKLSFRPIAVFPTSETLYPHYRDEIERAFNCPVRNQYSSSEGAPFITECTHGRLHYHLDTGVIEDGPDGTMLITSFYTYGTPLIRYEIGDSVRMGNPNETCPCGSALPIVEQIQGRTNEYVLSKSGRRYSFTHLSTTNPRLVAHVRKMQYIQRRPGEVHALIEADSGKESLAVAVMKEKLDYLFGDDMDVSIDVVPRITSQENGKFRLIINEMV